MGFVIVWEGKVRRGQRRRKRGAPSDPLVSQSPVAVIPFLFRI